MSVFRRHGYVNIPGSASLKTQKRSEQGDIAEVEAIACGTPFAQEVRGERLSSTLIHESFVAIPDDVFDRLLPTQAPLEQVLYLHLLRLCLAKERNFCRASRRELGERCQLSDRRLGAALAGLVDKNHIRLVDRNREGTLYRICFPVEIFGESSAPPDSHASSLPPIPAEPTATFDDTPQERPERSDKKQESPPKTMTSSTGKKAASHRVNDSKSQAPLPPSTTSERVDGVENRKTLATSAPLVSFARAAKAAAEQAKEHQDSDSSSSIPTISKPSASARQSRTTSASTHALLGHPASNPKKPKTKKPTPPKKKKTEPSTQGMANAPRGAIPAVALPKSDSPGSIASWFMETYGEGAGRSKSQLIEAIFDRLEAGRPFSTIRDEFTRFGEENPETPIAFLVPFLENKSD